MQALTIGAGLWLAAIVAAGAWLDLRYRRLPNWLCAIALLSGIGFGLALGGWPQLQFALLHALLALVVGIGLYALGGIGAGDAKYYAALAAWFPLWDAIRLLFTVSIAGLLLLIVWFLWRTRGRKARPRSADDEFGKLPYGIAISLGAAITFVMAHSPMP